MFPPFRYTWLVWIVCSTALWIISAIVLGLALEAAILLLAPLVLVPLALRLAKDDRGPPMNWLHCLAPVGAGCLVVSFALPQGWWLTVALAVPWLLVTLSIAAVGLVRLWQSGLRITGSAAVSAGLVLLMVGGAWTVISRAGLRPQGFSHAIVLLTAVHFHYAGFVLPILAGLAARDIGLQSGGGKLSPPNRARSLIDSVMLVSICLGVPMVGLGISLSPHVEVGAAFVLAVGCGILAVRQVQAAWVGKDPTRLTLSAVSSLSLVAAMVLASVYAMGEFAERAVLDIPTMIRTHGIFNAFGFAACGLAARLERPIT